MRERERERERGGGGGQYFRTKYIFAVSLRFLISYVH